MTARADGPNPAEGGETMGRTPAVLPACSGDARQDELMGRVNALPGCGRYSLGCSCEACRRRVEALEEAMAFMERKLDADPRFRLAPMMRGRR